MIEGYRNILANKFMRDTNYIIIKDTDDLEELERQWELFNASLTVRQQRLSDDRSIQIWNMTNKEHYEAMKTELIGEMEEELTDGDEESGTTISYDLEEYDDSWSEFEEPEEDNKIENLVNKNLDDFELPDDENEISEPVEEDTKIPTDGEKYEFHPKFEIGINQELEKDNVADQYEIDSNINIIGGVHGKTPEEYLANLEKSFKNWNAQSQDHRKKSDDKCREIYGMSNIDRYKKLKADMLELKKPKKAEEVSVDSNTTTTSKAESLGEFVSEVYRNMQVVNESEVSAAKQHRRLNDTPYFTPSEMIDMGVHGNHNYYCKDADNDGLITRVRTATWFDAYKDMCLDHIFEDYTKDWIDTLDYLYSDFEKIKESGDEQKILARKQSILDLGWNPNIPFTRRNRQMASKRVSKLLDKSSPMNIFVKLDKEVPDNEEAITDTPVSENAAKETHKPVYLVFVQGKTPIVSKAIKKATNSNYSHTGISFDSSLKDIHTYNAMPTAGIIKETLAGYKDNVITVMAFFAPNEVYHNMKDKVMEYYMNTRNTVYDWGLIFNKAIKKDVNTAVDKYHQICSTFVDTILQSGKVDLAKGINVPDPGQLYNATKSVPNKIIEVYNGPANKYNADKVEKKINKLLEKGTKAINESANILNEVKQFPVEFDKEGNLIIYKVRVGTLAYGDEIDDSVKLLESYRNTNNIEGMKYELAKLWFINDSIEKQLKKRLTNDQYKELIDQRATCLNVFKLNLEYVMNAEKGFNFSDYYNSTPFSDNSVKVTANTLKYSMKALASLA